MLSIFGNARLLTLEGLENLRRVDDLDVHFTALTSLVGLDGLEQVNELVLGGETNWLAWCQRDDQCPLGECVCGVCTAPCAAERPSCVAGPPSSACFASGSFGHAALCQGEASEGICLPVCATTAECPTGSSCAAGACLPSASTSTPPDGVEPPAPPDEEARAALGQFSEEWLGELNGRPWPLPPYAGSTPLCPFDPGCPTLEQLLSEDRGYDVRAGCGLHYVGAHEAVVGSSYWYESFGAPPVASFSWSDVGSSIGVTAIRPIDCDAIGLMCSTCGQDEPRCEDMPGAFPEAPPPDPIPGCACEPDGAGGARVSLGCFCSIYACPPTYSELILGCTGRLPATVYPAGAESDACGQVWFSFGVFASERFAFDAATGTLLGATASHGAPVTAPCGTYRVSAGTASDCAETGACVCSISGSDRCDGAAWFDALLP